MSIIPKSIHLPLIAVVWLSLFHSSHAQVFGNNPAANVSLMYVSVYEDCGYRGAGRNLPVGDYQDMRAIQMANDSLSSMRIPAGLQVSVYQDDRFGGFSTSFREDIECLDSGWNNQISSLRVNTTTASKQSDAGYYTAAGVDGTSVARVEFAETVLEKIRDDQWRLVSRAGQSVDFRQLDANEYAIYLQSNRDGQRLRVDFFTGDVTILARNGQQASYPMDRALRVDQSYRPPVTTRAKPLQAESQRGIVRGSCFEYSAVASGGDAGLRFNVGQQTFHRFASKPYRGRLCHQGELVMEINKTMPAALVTISIQGVDYTFAASEPHDELRNNWYRKRVSLTVRP
ncbi:MAG: hypothetical protein KJP04_09755, partial [Arenicella sp.]|nr:hypothetical protein [Arenicella sp.]